MTTAPTTSLAAFLLAQLNLDEAIAKSVAADPYRIFENHRGLPFRQDRSELRLRWYALMQGRPYQEARERVLAEVAAKRKIVELHQPRTEWDQRGECSSCGTGNYGCGPAGDPDHFWGTDWPCPTLRALAAVYVDAPGWQESWR